MGCWVRGPSLPPPILPCAGGQPCLTGFALRRGSKTFATGGFATARYTRILRVHIVLTTLMYTPAPNDPETATSRHRKLTELQRGVLVQGQGSAPLPNCLRVDVLHCSPLQEGADWGRPRGPWISGDWADDDLMRPLIQPRSPCLSAGAPQPSRNVPPAQPWPAASQTVP